MARLAFSDLTLGTARRRCASSGCKEETFWIAPRQKTLGHCPTHVSGDAGVTDIEARRALQRLFPGSMLAAEVITYQVHGEYSRWVLVNVAVRWLVAGYVVRFQAWALPLDAGPCRDCGAVIRAYGPQGLPFCAVCATQRGLLT